MVHLGSSQTKSDMYACCSINKLGFSGDDTLEHELRVATLSELDQIAIVPIDTLILTLGGEQYPEATLSANEGGGGCKVHSVKEAVKLESSLVPRSAATLVL